MSDFAELLERNRAFADRVPDTMTAMPAIRSFIVTCLDPRVEPADFLGITTGDAIVLRNPGGRLTPQTIADIALISAFGEVFAAEPGEPLEIAIIHHTQCGMGLLTDQGLLPTFSARTSLSEATLAARAITDPDVSVRQDVSRLRESPLATDRFVVSGHVFDLASGLVRTVVPVEATAGSTR